MIIGCLHTADSNLALMDRTLAGLGRPDVQLRHLVQPELLRRAEREGGLNAAIKADTVAALLDLARDCDGVILACSTLGPSVDELPPTDVPVLRLDGALADHAVSKGGHVVVLCTSLTTIDPTTALFTRAAEKTGARVDVRLVENAWPLLLAGDLDAYYVAIRQAVDAARTETETIALAQLSMLGALAEGSTILSSPAIGLRSAIEQVEARRPL